jgi:F-type H+-transporting ATPase subunit delta
MPRRPSAKRYALALYQLALERGSVESWHADLQVVDEAMQEREFAAFLEMPKILLSQKMSVIREGLPGIDPMVQNLMGVLISRDMASALPSVREEYGKLVDEQEGRERAVVRSAVPLEAGQIDRLAGYLGELVGKEVEVTTAVDPALLGGLVARVGDRLIDGSVRTRLQDMRKSLAETGY